MSKSYSNKALPSGTILREWRLEEVLGVGGFGIVYKGRGIYFDELVAIKEYFPSAISERKDGDTVVPIDSDAEEVHALGLKKFVEEAKLLWNLSTPTRHPNIVSVRSLFEIHGTAYMVMDFEDGVSLSRLLKDGRRFNEASLLSLIRPIAEGLDRAHRVGVLHRDIKPPNILVNEDGRPVLIDFGSARFESGDATSTKVTFHTPPYAAIEQYVKTYAQGPWTDIYALGVVLYECVAGEKPPEVLERMHGGLGKALADGDWPGYSRSFLKAVDAAMTIRPDDRPQSIPAWLAMFDAAGAAPAASAPVPAEGEDVTRVSAFADDPADIVPVAPPPPGFGEVHKVETPVPADTSQVQFKRAGQDTNASRKSEEVPPPPAATVNEGNAADTAPAAAADAPAKIAAPAPAPASASTGSSSKKPLLIGGGVLALLLAAGGWYLAGPGSSGGSPDPTLVADGLDDLAAPVTPIAISGVDGLAPALETLADDARRMRAPAEATTHLSEAATKIAALHAEFEKLTDNAARASAARDMEEASKVAATKFAAALVSDAEARARRLAKDQPWADPRKRGGAAGQPPERQKLANRLAETWAQLRASATQASSAGDPAGALSAASSGLVAFRGFSASYFGALQSTERTAQPTAAESPTAPVQAPAVAPTPTASEESARPLSAESGYTVPSARLQRFNSVVANARGIASDVISMGKRASLPSNPSDDDKANYRTLQANVKTAQGYVSYLDTLANSMRGVKNDGEVDKLVRQAEQTQSYLTVLLSRSTSAR